MERLSARAVRPGKENLSRMYEDLPLPLLPLPVNQLTGKECAQWLRSQIIRDLAESFGVVKKQVDWGKGQPPTFWPQTMVEWSFFSNPNQGQLNKEY